MVPFSDLYVITGISNEIGVGVRNNNIAGGHLTLSGVLNVVESDGGYNIGIKEKVRDTGHQSGECNTSSIAENLLLESVTELTGSLFSVLALG